MVPINPHGSYHLIPPTLLWKTRASGATPLAAPMCAFLGCRRKSERSKRVQTQTGHVRPIFGEMNVDDISSLPVCYVCSQKLYKRLDSKPFLVPITYEHLHQS